MSTVIIVDEHPIARHALRLLVEAEGHTVVAECGTGTDAIDSARRLRPTLLLLELAIPGLGGLETIQRMTSQVADVKILVVTGQSSDYFAVRSREAGALGFVSKQTDLQQVGMAVKAILGGHTFFPHNCLQAAPGVLEAEGDTNPNPLKALSARELTVLQLLAKGFASNAIGEQLLLSEKTISTYKSRVMQKLSAGSMLELLDIARRYGLVEASAFSSGDSEPEPRCDPLQAELKVLRDIIDTIPSPVSFRDVEGRLVMCNPAYLEQHALKLEEVVGRRIYETRELPGEHGRSVHDRVIAAMKQGQAYKVDVQLNIQGEHRVRRHWGKPYRDSVGDLIGLVCGNTDITDLDVSLSDLRRQSAKLAMTVQAKDQFMRWVIEEMAAPLSRIAAMLDLVVPSQGNTKQAEALDIACRATLDLQNIFDDFRDYLRVESGRQALTPKTTDVEQLLRKIVNEFNSDAQERGLYLNLHPPVAIYPLVWIDPKAFSRIVSALLSNAIKFTDHGGLR